MEFALVGTEAPSAGCWVPSPRRSPVPPERQAERVSSSTPRVQTALARTSYRLAVYDGHDRVVALHVRLALVVAGVRQTVDRTALGAGAD